MRCVTEDHRIIVIGNEFRKLWTAGTRGLLTNLHYLTIKIIFVVLSSASALRSPPVLAGQGGSGQTCHCERLVNNCRR